MGGLVVWGCTVPAPPRALTPTLSRRAGEGVLVAVEGTGVVGGVEMWSARMEGIGCLGLYGPRAAPCPHPNPLPPSGRGGIGSGGGYCVGWLVRCW